MDEMTTSSAAFSTDEQAILNELESGKEANQDQQQTPVETATELAQAKTDAVKTEPPKDQPTPREAALQAALRAARRGEARNAKAVAEAMERIKALESGQAQPQSSELSDDELAELANDFPAVAKIARRVKEVEQIVAAARPTAPQEFEPVAYVDDVQSDIDAVPVLFELQHDPARQEEFQKAIEIDEQLSKQPAWANKPRRERFAEVARQIAKPIQPQKRDPRQVIDALPVSQNGYRIGDLNGGASPNQNQPDYSRMTDEQIMASMLPD